MKKQWNERLRKFDLSVQAYHGVHGWVYRIIHDRKGNGMGLPLTDYYAKDEFSKLVTKIEETNAVELYTSNRIIALYRVEGG